MKTVIISNIQKVISFVVRFSTGLMMLWFGSFVGFLSTNALALVIAACENGEHFFTLAALGNLLSGVILSFGAAALGMFGLLGFFGAFFINDKEEEEN